MKFKIEGELDASSERKFRAIYQKCFSLPTGHASGEEHALQVLLEIGIDTLHAKMFGQTEFIPRSRE